MNYFNYYNRIIVLNDFFKTTYSETSYRIDFTCYTLLHYLRRDARPYEIQTSSHCIFISLPTSLNFKSYKEYILTYWIDIIKDAFARNEFIKPVSIFISNQNVEFYKVYYMSPIFNRQFESLCKVFCTLVFEIDTQPSNLKITSSSGYQNETSHLEYTYKNYMTDTR